MLINLLIIFVIKKEYEMDLNKFVEEVKELENTNKELEEQLSKLESRLDKNEKVLNAIKQLVDKILVTDEKGNDES